MVETAADRWGKALAEWAIPAGILEAAPESPWTFPLELFARRADAAPSRLTPSNRRALEALPEGGAVLDVGCGAGAASVRLAVRAGSLIGVDRSAEMLAAFADRAGRAGVDWSTIQGSWPDVALETPVADVAVCHHVVYNAPDLPEFARRLTDHARRRVVVELTATHPLSTERDLWKRFHGLERPVRPTADDAAAVLRDLELQVEREDWESPAAAGFAAFDDLVAHLRRRLCLLPDRDPEIAEAIRGRMVQTEDGFSFPPRPVVTLWWPGSAG